MLFLVWGTRHGSLSRGGARFRVRDNSWYFCLVFVIAPPPPPGRRGQNTCKIRPFSGRLVFSRALMHAGWRMHKKLKKCFLLKKLRRFQQKNRKTDRTRLRARTNLGTLTYDTEEVRPPPEPNQICLPSEIADDM